MSVQSIVADSPAIELQAEAQHTSGEIESPVSISCYLLFKLDSNGDEINFRSAIA